MTRENFLLNEELTVFSFGTPPVSIEILKKISGVAFDDAYRDALRTVFDDIELNIINLEHLRENKRKSGRFKDMDDLENLG